MEALTIVVSLISGFVPIVSIWLWNRVRQGALVRILGGLTKQEIDAIKTELSEQISKLKVLPSPSPSPSPSPHTEAGILRLKSVHEQTEIQRRFVNRMPETVVLYWINRDGIAKEFHRLNPGESYSVKTFMTHPWVVRTESNSRPVAVIVGTESRQVIEIDDGN